MISGTKKEDHSFTVQKGFSWNYVLFRKLKKTKIQQDVNIITFCAVDIKCLILTNSGKKIVIHHQPFLPLVEMRRQWGAEVSGKQNWQLWKLFWLWVSARAHTQRQFRTRERWGHARSAAKQKSQGMRGAPTSPSSAQESRTTFCS